MIIENQPPNIQTAHSLFAIEGLILPFVPASLQTDFKELAEWVYGTRDNTPPLYNIRHFVQEAEAGTDDYVLIGHDGHGVNSYAMHYYLVYGAINLFIQMSWGGAYTDNAKAAKRISNVFAQAEKLVKTAISLQQTGTLQDDRFMVILSNLYDQDRWRRFGSSDNGWHNTYTAIPDMQEILDSLKE